MPDQASNMAFQRTRRPRFARDRSLRSLGSPLNAYPFGGILLRFAATLSLVFALLPIDSLQAKCAFQRWVLTAEVKDCKTKAPVAGAAVSFFADDSPQSWPPEHGTVSEPLRTDQQGTFTGSFWLDTYSGKGLLVADRCTRKLRKITLFVTRDGYRPRRTEFQLKRLNVVPSSEGPTLRLPAIELVPQS